MSQYGLGDEETINQLLDNNVYIDRVVFLPFCGIYINTHKWNTIYKR